MKPIVTIYSCSFENYDWTIGPLAQTTNGHFIRFGDSAPRSRSLWEFKTIPQEHVQPSQTLINRHFKLFPRLVAGNCDVAIYVDGNILIKSDLMPLVEEFLNSRADLALFVHPSGRSLRQEIDFALKHRIPKQDLLKTEKQREKYANEGILDLPISENSILFYRMNTEDLELLGSTWWAELEAYSKRDQISLPYALTKVPLRVHYWTWHFEDPDNPYFQRYPHKSHKWVLDMKNLTFVMKDYSFKFKLLFFFLKSVGFFRRTIMSKLTFIK
jgi:hypothetical protein